MRRVASILAIVLVVGACSSGDTATEDGTSEEAPTTQVPADDVTTTMSQEAVTTTVDVDTNSSGSGDYSVIIVAGVDSLTGNNNLDSLHEAGFDGFGIEGSDDTGYTVFQSGLTRDEAEELLQAVRDELFEGSDLPGLIGETDVWFGDS